jgi:serpin B
MYIGGMECFAVEPEALPSVVQANNEFGLDLYAELCREEGNIFFSPFSLSSALAMTYAGAEGETAQQMAETLHFPTVREALHASFRSLIEGLTPTKDGCQLYTANALWAQKEYPFLTSYLSTVQTHYRAELNLMDFVAAAEDARKTINNWVEKQTRDKIQELIQPGMLDALTRLVLTNAIYFKGYWATQFDPGQTQDGPFYLSSEQTITAPLMHQTDLFKFLETPEFQAIELPYKGDALSMAIFLPREIMGLAELERTLSPTKLSEWFGKLVSQEVSVFIPRFKFASQFSLEKTLARMGMPLAFSSDADFSGMTGNRELFISAVVHKAYVDVNEEGTEAAAATGVVMRVTAAPAPPPVFRADHPFLFLIRDNRSGSILFLGRVANPTSA